MEEAGDLLCKAGKETEGIIERQQGGLADMVALDDVLSGREKNRPGIAEAAAPIGMAERARQQGTGVILISAPAHAKFALFAQGRGHARQAGDIPGGMGEPQPSSSSGSAFCKGRSRSKDWATESSSSQSMLSAYRRMSW